ncbi:hypothetical protein BSL78_13561 [Apostichopus japonicus]|uniref:Uncharacterized protein n=1 Tax=Stichopus japonicus TaxID=307972 RepID=A0A2G8KNF7_STIJA|nr:hypothetical protein BSL78_13561 [Apostichopus japonicus]
MERRPRRQEMKKLIIFIQASGTSVTSSVRLREAKVNKNWPTKEGTSIKERELRRKQMEINERIEDMKLDNEVENADVEAAMWQEEWMSKPSSLRADPIPSAVKQRVDVPKRTEEWCKNWETIFRRLSLDLTRRVQYKQCNNNIVTLQPQMHDLMLMSMNLPKPDIPNSLVTQLITGAS